MANTSTGIIRRIDDLGRVVIPREIRRDLGIREGDPLEISIDKEHRSVTFTQYCPLSTTFSRDSRAIIGAMRHTYPDVKVAVYNAAGDTNTQNYNLLMDEAEHAIPWVNKCRTSYRTVCSLDYPGNNESNLFGVIPIILDGDFLGYVLVSSDWEAQKTAVDVTMFAAAVKSVEALVDFVVKSNTW